MATVVLQVAGAAIGGAIGGPVGAVVGRAVGAAAGYFIDHELFGPDDRAVEGPRLNQAQYLSSEEGSPIVRAYGRTRLSGQVIWATRFEEVQETETQGGKGGPKTSVTSYSYFANFAIGLCEGEVACVRRIWADGKPIDQNNLTIRFYKGNENQLPDSLIEAKQGAGNAPAYRGLAYLVFERLPLEAFGNRIPQISVEIIKPVGQLEKRIKAVALLPGASEFGYDPLPVVEKIDPLSSRGLNSHTTISATDWAASIDELQAICPNLQSVALISSWFGNDLRAGQCTCRPLVEIGSRNLIEGEAWQVNGQLRASTPLVSQINGRPAFGGTPCDGSIIRAIQDIHQRGLKVTFYPFLMMDIPAGNALPDPYGASEQASYPWRGRITCNPAIGQPGSIDKTAAAKAQIDAFVGQAVPANFSIDGNTVIYTGPAEWSYRRLILHYAKLCALAGGVEAFLIGSELRGLTRVSDNTGAFPFVDHLRSLAADVRSILGPSTKISYAADWSEYFGYQPPDGSGDVHYNLDPLWADSNIDMVAIDNYMPVSDWRDEGAPDDIGTSARDVKVMADNIAAGEGYDWYYASSADRFNGVRTPITDGLGKPWIYRYKDLKSWWENSHIPRMGGVEQPSATAWLPQMKPLWFTELGCPAIDKGANQPNVFVDAKSSESFFPYFSAGSRDDAVQAAFIEAHQHHWDEALAGFDTLNNPLATTYGQRMVDADNIHLWAWDVRPFPQFPDNSDLWSDGDNWRLGHWLNGRIGSARLADLIAEILGDHNIGDFDVSGVHGFADGYVVASLTSARGALQGLVDLYQIQVFENGNGLIFRTPDRQISATIPNDDLAEYRDDPQSTIKRIQETELPNGVVLEHVDPKLEFQPSATRSMRIEGGSERQVSLNAPLMLPRELALPLVDNWLQAAWIGRNALQVRLPHRYRHLQIGDHVEFDNAAPAGRWLITRIEEADTLLLDLRSIELPSGSATAPPAQSLSIQDRANSGLPLVHLMDLPLLIGEDAMKASRIAVSSNPWPGPHEVYSAPDGENFSYRQTVLLRATMGELITGLAPGIAGRWDYSSQIDVQIYKGTLSSQPMAQVLNGANVAAIRSSSGAWEIIQFLSAELVGTNIWRLSGILRAQAGTEIEMLSGAAVAAPFVLIDKAAEVLAYDSAEVGLDLDWVVAAPGNVVADPANANVSFAPGKRGYLPLSPVRLQAMIQANDDVSFNWIRRDRVNADAWNDGEIPMSEASELYSVSIKSGATILRQWQAGTTSVTYSRAEQLADLASFPASLTLEVAQISASHGPGAPSQLAFILT